jgi:CBS domain-containing protein
MGGDLRVSVIIRVWTFQPEPACPACRSYGQKSYFVQERQEAARAMASAAELTRRFVSDELVGPALEFRQGTHARLEARMKKVRQMLHEKAPLLSVAPTATVYDALVLMARHDVGALVVLDQERLVGMFSERDYARKVILQGKASKDLAVSEIMTPRVLYVGPDDSVEGCMALMTDKHVRHLPVVEADTVIGLVSIGDVVKALLHEQQFFINQLERYITA